VTNTMLKKFFMSAVLLFGLFSAPLYAQQTAAELEGLLQTQAVSYGQAARFVLEAADAAKLNDQERAHSFAMEKKWLPQCAAGDDARLDGVSLLLMQSFAVKGGMGYSLTKSSHYAYRELVYQDIIQGLSDPKMTVSGEHLLFLINRLLSRRDNEVYTASENKNPAAASTDGAPLAAPLAAQLTALADEINTQLGAMSVTDTSARVTAEGVTISLSKIQFLANSSELPESEKKKLREIAQILKTIPARKILVSGHTARAGSEHNQMKISLERAQAAANFLIALGVRKANEIEVRGYGARRPIATNKTAAGMALNRRVEITILENKL